MIFSNTERKFERARADRAERSALIRKLRRERTVMVWGGVFGIVGGLAFGTMMMIFSPTQKNLTAFNEITPILIPISIGLLIWGMLAHQDIKMLILIGDTAPDATNKPAEQD